MMNLDAMSEEELGQATVAFNSLAEYARYKKFAMTLRKDGMIESALAQEANADVVYKTLPEWARW